ncbi:DUF2314 domain-containing protein [Sphingomonas sp. AOB5]|uniref:DUF2314 domain-containing protein n=1 Tax=Sphingomonas sp. AOB5 TaxID=3034017 RepID=UPI0023F61F8C|nr:DUF2314 domain-containing protein [Sphingomonas sp. AOB5]MDF7777661.1 DUF2314 domain-containing protein [Sphingomonas sp. AOB5]
MRISVLALAALIFALPPAAHAQKAGEPAKAGGVEKPRDDVMMFSEDDPEMNAAIARARAEVPDFLLHLITPRANKWRFMVKYDLDPGDAAEYIWAEIVSREPGGVTATLSNVPMLAGFKQGQTVTIRDEQIVDWSYVRDGVMQGNYTTRVILDRMPAAEADPIRRNLGW